MIRFRTLCAIFTSFLTLFTVAVQANPSTTVFAAASLREALDDVAERFPDQVAISYSGSGTIARQIAQGAPADVVILANSQWMDWLDARGTILTETRINLLRNSLVVVGPKDTPAFKFMDGPTLLAALGDGRLAMGQRDGVPAGIYAHEWLAQIGAWDLISPQLAETENVRAALALVARAETPLGIVYATDALADVDVTVVWAIPNSAHSDIFYSAAAVTDAGKKLMEFLKSDEATLIFSGKGFLPLGAPK